MNSQSSETNYRWYILFLAALTNTVTVAIPSMSLPVLFKEISTELNLDLVQVGLIWGIGALPGIVAVLVGGVLGDRFGPKRILSVACFLVGLSGALRGLSGTFAALAASVFLFGLLASVIPTNTLKTCGLWFPQRQLGLASGVTSMGMAFGFMLGSLISATVLSPWMGGWRNVMIFYGVIGMALSIPWVLTRPVPTAAGQSAGASPTSLRDTVSYVAGIKTMWLLGCAILGIGGCIQGTLGYLPLYLRGLGWTPASADGALSTFHLSSLICVIPIALWSDKLGSRRKVLMLAAILITIGVGLLSIADGVLVWVAVIMAGFVRDGFMAVFMTMIIETEGIGPAYAGTAMGLVMVFSGLGNLIAPPLGNGLAQMAPGLSFALWAILAVMGLFALYSTREIAPEPALAVK